MWLRRRTSISETDSARLLKINLIRITKKGLGLCATQCPSWCRQLVKCWRKRIPFSGRLRLGRFQMRHFPALQLTSSRLAALLQFRIAKVRLTLYFNYVNIYCDHLKDA
jgi:hypothetical protein